MRQILPFFLILVFSISVLGQWTQDPEKNAQLTPLDGQDRHRKIIPASDQGWYILYDHFKDNDEDVRLALVDSIGNIIWDKTVYDGTEGGTRYSDMISDDVNGVIVKWADNKLQTSTNIYAQRVNQNGDLLWGSDDILVGVSEGTEFCSKLISDGQGGAIITLFDDDPPGDELKGLYVFRIDHSGQRLWRTLIIGSGSFSCNNSENSENYDICTDNAGGAYIFYNGADPIPPLENKLRGMHLDSTGNKLWPDEFITVGPVSWPAGMTIHSTEHGTFNPRAVPNMDGTAYVLWTDHPGLFDPNIPEHIRGQHLNIIGETSWSDGGKMLNTENETSPTIHAISDNDNNIYFTFHDGENYILQKILPDGSRPWGNGVIFRNSTAETIRSLVLTSCQDVIISYFYSPAPNSEPNIYSTRIDQEGQYVWNQEKLRVSALDNKQVDARIAINDKDELIAIWLDQSTTGSSNDFNIYMQGFDKWGDLGGIMTGVWAPSSFPLTITPNPASKNVNLSLGAYKEGGRLILTDIQGNVKHREIVSPGFSEILLNLENLSGGLYFINLYNESYILSAKLVVAK